jgi:3-hydroxyacyl-[acyl-carrier protein] dehydratase/trans-2-decenoyl-[acyl-carrier protein] isomerase
MFDRVTLINTDGGKFGKGQIISEKDILYDEWFFFCHFQGDPVMPGVLQVDAILQLAGFFLMHNKHDGYGRALRTGKISFREQVRPHHKLVTYKLDFKKIMNRPNPMAFANAIAEVDGELSAEVDGIIVAMFPDLGYKYP